MKNETVEEFLARGGQVIKLQPGEQPKGDCIRSSMHGGPATILTLEEADLFFGEHKKSTKKKKKKNIIDLSALPEALRIKYVDGVTNEDEDSE